MRSLAVMDFLGPDFSSPFIGLGVVEHSPHEGSTMRPTQMQEPEMIGARTAMTDGTGTTSTQSTQSSQLRFHDDSMSPEVWTADPTKILLGRPA